MQLLQHLHCLQIGNAIYHDLIVHETDTLLQGALHSLDNKVTSIPVVNLFLIDDLFHGVAQILVACQQVAFKQLLPAKHDPLVARHEVLAHDEIILLLELELLCSRKSSEVTQIWRGRQHFTQMLFKNSAIKILEVHHGLDTFTKALVNLEGSQLSLPLQVEQLVRCDQLQVVTGSRALSQRVLLLSRIV